MSEIKNANTALHQFLLVILEYSIIILASKCTKRDFYVKLI